MMAPHWLDSIFQNPDHAFEALVASDHFKAAVAKAQAAYREAQNQQIGIVGGSPAQQARVTFLEALKTA